MLSFHDGAFNFCMCSVLISIEIDHRNDCYCLIGQSSFCNRAENVIFLVAEIFKSALSCSKTNMIYFPFHF